MSESENLKIAKDLYNAIEQRDLQRVLNLLSEDAEWYMPGSSNTPASGKYQGHNAISDLFVSVVNSVEFEQFEPQEWFEKKDKIVVLGYEVIRVKSTNKRAEYPWVHELTLQQGKIIRLREYLDTAAISEAFQH
ncbi:MAG: nuclear transport factor 2 family protein [Brasilonema angustatum HA4187-MV1]|jgi:hypothetical protein|nr:nuclear transport factor 2 family protein [Brasilonema angustatum HA4187-MV1]